MKLINKFTDEVSSMTKQMSEYHNTTNVQVKEMRMLYDDRNQKLIEHLTKVKKECDKEDMKDILANLTERCKTLAGEEKEAIKMLLDSRAEGAKKLTDLADIYIKQANSTIDMLRMMTVEASSFMMGFEILPKCALLDSAVAVLMTKRIMVKNGVTFDEEDEKFLTTVRDGRYNLVVGARQQTASLTRMLTDVNEKPANAKAKNSSVSSSNNKATI